MRINIIMGASLIKMDLMMRLNNPITALEQRLSFEYLVVFKKGCILEWLECPPDKVDPTDSFWKLVEDVWQKRK